MCTSLQMPSWAGEGVKPVLTKSGWHGCLGGSGRARSADEQVTELGNSGLLGSVPLLLMGHIQEAPLGLELYRG